MSHLEFSRIGSFPSPGFDELSGLVELENTRITHRARSVSLRQKHVSIPAERNVIGLTQEVRSGSFIPVARLSLRTEREKHLTLRAQLDDRVTASIGYPDVAIRIEMYPVRTITEQAFSK